MSQRSPNTMGALMDLSSVIHLGQHGSQIDQVFSWVGHNGESLPGWLLVFASGGVGGRGLHAHVLPF